MYKGGNSDTVLSLFSSLATPVSQIIQTYLLYDQFKILKERVNHTRSVSLRLCSKDGHELYIF